MIMGCVILSIIVWGIILSLSKFLLDEKERTDDVFANNDDPAVDCHRKFCLLSDDLFKQLCVIDGSAYNDTIGNLRCWDFCDHKIQITAVLEHAPPKTYILYDNKMTQQKKKFYKYEKFVEFFEQHNLEIKQQILQYNLSKDFT